MIDWNDLRHFLAVAETGSTLAASRALGVNQSTVARRIAALEAELGLRLFDKTRSGYRPTGSGQVLLARALEVEAAVQGFCRSAAGQDAGLAGSLRLATAEGIAYGLISPILDAFHRHHPGLRVTLLLDDHPVDLGRGTADVAVRAGKPGDGTLVGRKLTNAAWAVYASRAYVAEFGAPVEPAELNAHRVIGFDGALGRIGAARWLDRVAPGAETVSRSNSILGHLLTVRSGYGIACLPVHIGDPEPDLLRVIGPLPELMGEFWLLTHPELREAAKVRAFFDFLTAEIRTYRPLLLGRTRETYAAGPLRAVPSA